MVKLGSSYNVEYLEENVAGTLQDDALDQYITLGIVTNFKEDNEVGNVETKGLTYDYVSKNAQVDIMPKFSLDFEWTGDIKTLLANFFAASQVNFSFIVKDEAGATDIYYIYTGATISKFKVTTSVSAKKVTGTIDFTALTFVKQTADPLSNASHGSAQYSAANSLLYTSTGVEKVAASGWIYTGDVDVATAWELEVDYNVKQRQHLNQSTFPARNERTGYTVKGSITSDYESANEIEELMSGTTGSLKIYLDAPTNTEYFTITGVRYESIPKEIKEWDMIELKTPFIGKTCSLT